MFNRNKINVCITVKKHRDVINFMNIARGSMKHYEIDCKVADDSDFTVVSLGCKYKDYRRLIKALGEHGYKIKDVSKNGIMKELIEQIL